MKHYVIVAPPFLTTSAGVLGLHLLKDHLIAQGQQCRTIIIHENGTIEGLLPADDEIAIIPDCFNLRAKNTVRYLMMFAGYFGPHTPSSFDASELMYYYSPEFCFEGRNQENILSIPMLNEEKFRPSGLAREGSCYLAIKYQDYFGYPVNLPNCTRITKNIDLALLFSKVQKLITFDNSAINLEAALAGVEVEYRFNEKFQKPFEFGEYFDYNNIIKSYAEQKKIYFEHQLPEFIKRTQERFK